MNIDSHVLKKKVLSHVESLSAVSAARESFEKTDLTED